MRIVYFADTDTLYIGLRPGPAAETEERPENVFIDYDASGQILALTFDAATQQVDLSALEIENMPPARIIAGPAAVPAATST